MNATGVLTRVVLRNYKSIATCDVALGPLTYLVGANGSGKSNFVDALHLVRDALTGSLDNALNERGGLSEVRRRSSGHPTHFGMRLEFRLRDGRSGHYAFNIGALSGRGYEVQTEECALDGLGKGPYFRLERGDLKASSEATFPCRDVGSLGTGERVRAGGVSTRVRRVDGDGVLQPKSKADP